MKFILYVTMLSVVLFACEQKNEIESEQFYAEETIKNDGSRLQIINDSLRIDPDNLRLLLEKGKIAQESLDFNSAIHAGARAFRIDSTNLEARELYAWTLINKPNAPLSDIETAQRHYQYILSVKPNNPETMVYLANTYSLTGDFKTALTYINDAIRINERYKDAYVLKGSIYKVLGNNDIALSSYQTAVQLDPNYFIGHLQIGWLLTELGNHKLALEYYRNAVELQPKNINAIYGVAKTFQDMGKYDDALENYRKIEKINPDFYITFFNQGVIKQYFQHEKDSAKYFYDKVLRLHPEYIKAWVNLGDIYLEEERMEEAAHAYAEALRLDEDYIPAREGAEKIRRHTFK